LTSGRWKGQVRFHDVAYIEVTPRYDTEVVCEAGRLIKVSKDRNGVVTQDVLTKHWTDWVDYWAVDFDYQSRKEIVRMPTNLGVEGEIPGIADATEFIEFEERWTGSYIFENQWQSFRTRKDRSIDLVSAPHVYAKPGHYIVAVKVIDIFGNDTMSLRAVTIA
jgi:site-specific DNA-methyltransferase (adenine-specific)/adenine-specific DNA-methyltransferase